MLRSMRACVRVRANACSVRSMQQHHRSNLIDTRSDTMAILKRICFPWQYECVTWGILWPAYQPTLTYQKKQKKKKLFSTFTETRLHNRLHPTNRFSLSTLKKAHFGCEQSVQLGSRWGPKSPNSLLPIPSDPTHHPFIPSP